MRLARVVAIGGLVSLGAVIFASRAVGISMLVNAPNRGLPPPAAKAGEVIVAVGPPAASLSIEVIDVPDARGTVFLLHGIGDSKESMRSWVPALTHEKFRAVLVDLRGHGRSTGDTLSYGIWETKDLTTVANELLRKGLIAPPLAVMGCSYGAATAIEWAGREPRLFAVVAVAPFESLRKVVPYYAPKIMPAAWVKWTIETAGAREGWDPDQANPLLEIQKTRAPVLLIHGTADKNIPAEQSKDLYAAARDHSELVLVEGEDHDTIFADKQHVISTRMPAWFARYVPTAEPIVERRRP